MALEKKPYNRIDNDNTACCMHVLLTVNVFSSNYEL